MTAGVGPLTAAEPTAAGRVDQDASRLRFVYPFTFSGPSLGRRSTSIAGSEWESGSRRHPIWLPGSFPSEDLLTHVADFLNPQAGAEVTARLWHMDESALRSPQVLGGGARHPGADWNLATPGGEIAFVIDSVELALFRHGAGFLTVTAMPASSAVGEWFDFTHHFRFARGERACAVSATRVTGRDGESGEAIRIPFFPRLAGFGAAGAEGPHLFGEVIDGLLGYAALDTDEGRWWGEVFVPGMMLPHVGVFVDGIPGSDVGVTLYRVRNFFHSRQVVHPSEADLGLADAGLMGYAARQWFFFSLNGGGFLACDAPSTPFFRVTLPDHVSHKYFLLFLLALQQRFVLMRLSQQVSAEWVAGEAQGSEGARAAAFARIRDDLLAFTAQGYFAQTMQEEHHHRCYRRWQEAFQLTRLYDQVGTEVREMHSYLEMRHRLRAEQIAREQEQQAIRLDRRLARISWLLGIPVALLLAVNASGSISQVRQLVLHGPPGVTGYDLLIGLGLDVVGVLLGYLAYRLLNRPPRRRGRGRARNREGG